MPSDYRVTDDPTFLHTPRRKEPVELPKGVLPIAAGSTN